MFLDTNCMQMNETNLNLEGRKISELREKKIS